MTIKRRDNGSVLRTITAIRARDSGGTLRTITKVRGRDADNELRVLWAAGGGVTDTNLVKLSTYNQYTSASGAASSGTVTTPAITATGQFGTPPYTYLWSRLTGAAGGSGNVSCSNVNIANPTFTGLIGNDAKTAGWHCKATDSLGVSKFSPDLSVTLEWIDTR